MEIGKKIREARIAKGLTQEELGKIVGLQNSAIAKYESVPTCCLSSLQRKEEVSLLFFNSRVLFPPPLSHAACG